MKRYTVDKHDHTGFVACVSYNGTHIVSKSTAYRWKKQAERNDNRPGISYKVVEW